MKFQFQLYKWLQFTIEVTDHYMTLCSLSVFEEGPVKIVIDLEAGRAFKKLPLRLWLWMTFFFCGEA